MTRIVSAFKRRIPLRRCPLRLFPEQLGYHNYQEDDEEDPNCGPNPHPWHHHVVHHDVSLSLSTSYVCPFCFSCLLRSPQKRIHWISNTAHRHSIAFRRPSCRSWPVQQDNSSLHRSPGFRRNCSGLLRSLQRRDLDYRRSARDLRMLFQKARTVCYRTVLHHHC